MAIQATKYNKKTGKPLKSGIRTPQGQRNAHFIEACRMARDGDQPGVNEQLKKMATIQPATKHELAKLADYAKRIHQPMREGSRKWNQAHGITKK
jgi:hypothetical protein